MASIINNQPVYIQQLDVPQVTNLNTTPSLSPILGTIAHDVTDPASLYVGDGTTWNKISSSASSGGIINGAIIQNSKILSNNTIGNIDTVAPGHTFFSFASVPGRSVGIPDATGEMVLTTATQTLLNKTINNLTSAGTTDSMLSNRVQRFYFSGTSTGNTPITVLTLNTTINTSLSYRYCIQGFVTTGTNVNGGFSRLGAALVQNVAGSSVIVGQNTFFTSNTSGLNGAALTILAGTLSAVVVSFTGVAGNNIAYSGYVEVNT